MITVNAVNALLKEWLWVKRIAELCDEVRIQFEVFAQRCSALLTWPRDFPKELDTIRSEIGEKQRALLTARLEHPVKAEQALISASRKKELITNAMQCLRHLAANGDPSAKEVLTTFLVTFPEFGDPEDRVYPFCLELEGIANLVDSLDARKNALLIHELRRQFLVAVARSLYLDPEAPAWPERPMQDTFSLFFVNVGRSALCPRTRWYAGYVQQVRRSRCTLEVSHWATSRETFIPEEGTLDVPVGAFVTGEEISAP